jgi:YegS/Rv2252/BmrU family lipid kinase
MKRALLIVNRQSGSGDWDADTLPDLLRRHGIDAEQALSPEPEAIDAVIEKEAVAVDLIVLGGGDGTFSHSIGAIARTGKPLGVLPMGTANDFARSLRIPPDVEKAVEIIAAGHMRQIDIGVINERPFLNVASIGLAAEIAKVHGGWIKRALGVLSYPFTWGMAYRQHRPFRATISCDGEEIRCRCSQLAVGNGRHYGGGLTLSDDAEVDDGELKLYYLEPLGVLGWVRALPSLRFGTLDGFRKATFRRAMVVDVATDREKSINVDGELSETTPARFRIRPKALAVFAPPPVDRGRTAAAEQVERE